MTSPIVAFKVAAQQWLLLDTAILAHLRGAKIFTDQPKHAAYPHIAFVNGVARENDTSSEAGHVLELTLGIWSRHLGSEESLTIAASVDQRLATMPKVLNGHRLINLMTRSVEPTRLRDGETWKTELRIRAVTEVI